MAAKYDTNDEVIIKGRVVSATTDETGTVYQIKFSAQDKMVTQFFEENELEPVEP